MTLVLAVLTGMSLVLGVMVFIIGARREERQPPKHVSLTAAAATRIRNIPGPVRTQAIVGLVAGIAAYALTGWALLAPTIFIAAIGLPWLLGDPPQRDIELLAALDRWISLVATSLPTGKSIRDAIRATHSQVPASLSDPIRLLLERLDDRWPTQDAFFAMADELDSPDADPIIAALSLAAQRGGTGASTTLHALSHSVQDRLRAARDIENERAKPRIVVRQVSAISTAVLGIALIMGGSFFAPYRSGIGLVIIIALLSAYAGSLVMLRKMATPPKRPRLLVSQGVIP